MVMGRGADGSPFWVSAAAARESKKILDDKDISWDNFTQAVPRMLVAMTNAGWAMERVVMLGQFWGNLQTHELRRSQDPLDQTTLLAYQAKHRLQWHMAIASPGGAYNLAIIDENCMRAIREEVYWKSRAQKDNARDCEFFLFALTKAVRSPHCLSYPPLQHPHIITSPSALPTTRHARLYRTTRLTAVPCTHQPRAMRLFLPCAMRLSLSAPRASSFPAPRASSSLRHAQLRTGPSRPF